MSTFGGSRCRAFLPPSGPPRYRRSCSPSTRRRRRRIRSRACSIGSATPFAPVTIAVRPRKRMSTGSSGISAPGQSSANDEATLSCSFCRKTQRQVRKLIAGSHVYICDECVELCNDILQEEWESRQVPDHAPPSNQSTIFKHSASCSLCHLPAAVGELLPILERGFLCAACVQAVQNAAGSAER